MLSLLLLAAAPNFIEISGFDRTRRYSFDGVPNLEFVYYDVTGSTLDEIRASLHAGERFVSETSPGHGARTDITVNWHFFFSGAGRACKVEKIDLTYKITVVLPRLVHPERVEPAVLERWTRYLAAVRSHEAGHVHNRIDHLAEARAAGIKAGCVNGEKALKASLDKYIALDRQYDADSRGGVGQGALF